ncbi:MAG: FeoA family protein [Candidatus Saelkia tenebricola]|nr:FeoA family protein [Candidatus Saelkia tenebricola]
MLIDITHLKPGEEGVIKEITGGTGLISRMQNMGIRTGETVKKISSHFWCGPQTVEVGRCKVAVGHGVAKKIIIEVER